MPEETILEKVKSVEFFVGSAKQWAFMHQNALGFRLRGYAGPETGIRDRVSYLLSQGDANFIFTSFINPDDFVGKHIHVHGDGVKDVAFQVNDIDYTISEIEKRKLIKPAKIETVKTDNGKIKTSYIPTFGETIHSLQDLGDYDSDLPPGFEHVEDDHKPKGIKSIDHIVGNVEEKRMDDWVNYYINGLGFKQLMSFDDKDISTEYSALQSKVVEYNNRKIVFPINEPAWGLKKSQIQEYLDYYKSPGVQHIAFLTDNIIETVKRLKQSGVEFLPTPKVYYDDLEERVGKIKEDIDKIRDLDILVDRDEYGYLLQIFTKPIGDRPTVFYEIIQRRGAISFGKGNFKSLFESIEREQAKRGNL